MFNREGRVDCFVDNALTKIEDLTMIFGGLAAVGIVVFAVDGCNDKFDEWREERLEASQQTQSDEPQNPNIRTVDFN